jgi:hypothetical protein
MRPSWPDLTTMSSNWDGSFSRPTKVRFGWKARSAIGGLASWPPAICRFWARIAATTSFGQAEIGDLVGIEPQPHRIIACAEDLDVADAVKPQQLVAHLQQRIVGDVELVERVVGDSMKTTIRMSGESSW